MATDEAIIRQSIWTPEHQERLLVVQPNWTVELAGDRLQYQPIESLCLAGLIVAINQPSTPAQVYVGARSIMRRNLEAGGTAPVGYTSGEVLNKSLLSSVMSKRTELYPHLYELGKPRRQRSMLVERAGDKWFLRHALDTYLKQNKTEDDQLQAIVSSASQKFFADWGVHLKDDENRSNDTDTSGNEPYPHIMGVPLSIAYSKDLYDNLDTTATVIAIKDLRRLIGRAGDLSDIEYSYFGNEVSVLNYATLLVLYRKKGERITTQQLSKLVAHELKVRMHQRSFESLYLQDIERLVRGLFSSNKYTKFGIELTLYNDSEHPRDLSKMSISLTDESPQDSN